MFPLQRRTASVNCRGAAPRTAAGRGALGLRRLRRLWRRFQRERPKEVEMRHVRSHTGVPGNELADWLTESGRTPKGNSAESKTLQEATDWLDQWLKRHHVPRPPG